MKKFLAKKRKDRAARWGGENSDMKAKSAVAHTQQITRFLSSACTGVLDGITGDENQGRKTSAAKGISTNLCDNN